MNTPFITATLVGGPCDGQQVEVVEGSQGVTVANIFAYRRQYGNEVGSYAMHYIDFDRFAK